MSFSAGVIKFGIVMRCFRTVKLTRRLTSAKLCIERRSDGLSIASSLPLCRHHRRMMSTLYTAFGDGEKVPFLSRPDIDIEHIMNNIDFMKDNVTARNVKFDFQEMVNNPTDLPTSYLG